MHPDSVPTRGRTLDYGAPVYDMLEPLLMLGKLSANNRRIIDLLSLQKQHRVLDLGCGTGTLTRAIGDRLDAEAGGMALGIDAAAGMIRIAAKKRASTTCRFEVVAAESLPYADTSFDAVVSSLFFHHVDRDLKERAIREAFRVLRSGGLLVVADMHTPTTFMGSLVSHAARWLLVQPQIGENIAGVLPELMLQAGFEQPRLNAMFMGYIALFSTRKAQVHTP
ncbi:MAG: methyltransferase domain-containing protein [Deltaproteobacteria bacterium]|nr:methyltransferase domain-containing protein [Deltaproteobacteria bacterium]